MELEVKMFTLITFCICAEYLKEHIIILKAYYINIRQNKYFCMHIFVFWIELEINLYT